MSEEIVLVGGGSGGIGSGIVKGLARPGRKIYFSYNRNAAKARELEKKCQPNAVKGLPCDVTQPQQVRGLVEQILAQEEKIDVLINAFGITQDKPLLYMEDEEWLNVIATNLHGVYYMTRATIFAMLKRRSGNIINIGSVSGEHGMPGQTNYAASKAGVVGFSKSLAKEVSARGIRVNVIAPGFIESAMTEKLTEQYLAGMKKNIPLGRLGQPEDLTGVIELLISEQASYITGQVINVDGGLFI